MDQLRLKLQNASKARLPLILAVYILCQPLIDALTGLGAQAEHPVTAGVVVRSLVIVLAFLYTVFVSGFPDKKRWMAYTGALVGYLALFMGYMFSLGGLSLCVANVKEVVKTFFAPFVFLFLWSVYKQYGYLVTCRAIAWAGGLYASVIPLAQLTGTGFVSYTSSGYGNRGWFYAANEVGCILAITAPFTVWYCLEVLPTVTKKTWWKGALAAWALIAVSISATSLGTKIVFAFTFFYCLAVLVWQVVRLARERSRANAVKAAAAAVLVLLFLVVTPDSPFLRYLFEVYITNLPRPPEATVEVWDEAIAHACQNTWLYDLIKSNKTIADIDQIFSRRFISASPAVQVFTESGVVGRLLGIGYATAPSYSREMYFMVELDPLAVLLRHGVVGFVLYFVPYLWFIGWSIVQFFRRPLQRLADLRYCTALYCTLAGFAISVLAGHALVSPAVATFVLAVSMQLWDQTQEQNKLPKAAKS